MAAEKGEKAEEKEAATVDKGQMDVEVADEKGATAADKGQMGVEAADEEKRARAVEKGEMGVKVVDEDKGATAADMGQMGVEVAYEEKGATMGVESVNEEKRARAAEKGETGVKVVDEDKGATAADKGQMGVEAVDEEKGARAVGKGEPEVKVVDEEKGATAADKGQMGVEAVDEEKGARAVEKGESEVKVVDEEKGAATAGKAATVVESEEEDSPSTDDEGATVEGKGNKRETIVVEKESTTDLGLEWKWKVAAAAGGEERAKLKREMQRRTSMGRDRDAEAEKKEEDMAATTKGAGEKAVFFFSVPAVRKMITLVSSEGRVFEMSKAAARLSVVLANMIDNGCTGGNIPLPNIDGRALAMVIKYCDKHVVAELESNHNITDEGDSSSGTNTAVSKKALDEWDRKLVQDLTQDALYDLITAADFLNIKGLLEACCKKVTDMIKKKTPAQVRAMFNIANDFTAEEEEEIRKESPWVFDEWEASDGEEV